MSIYDDAQLAARKVIEDKIGLLNQQFEQATQMMDDARSAFDEEKTAHGATKTILASALAEVSNLETKIQALEAQLSSRDVLVASLRARIAELEASAGPANYRPISYKTLDDARTGTSAPADATYVEWKFGNASLEEAFMQMKAGEILYLPEREAPYLLDSAGGFRAAGISWIAGSNGSRIPIASTYKGKAARTWFGLARARRGILGAGPGAVIEVSDSGYAQEQQIYPGHVTDKGNVMTGNAYKLIEVDEDNAFMANFTLRGRDLGAMAYNGIVFNKSGVTRRVYFDGASRGFSAAPNGETGALAYNNGTYVIDQVEINCRDKNGKRVSTSPVMINKSKGGTISESYFHESYAGSITIWGSTGTHQFLNVRSEFLGAGINLEANTDLKFVWSGGTNYVDYKHTGEWPNIPDTNYRGNSGLHVNLRSPYTSTKVHIQDVKIDKGPLPGSLSVQMYGATGTEPRKQINSDITSNLPVKVYGY